MVQRKVINKLGIQADHVKSDKLLATLKLSSVQQDGKNKAADLKKKMKKSGSNTKLNLESFFSPNMKRHASQPGKPPPADLNINPATTQKPSPIKASEMTPNYMKSTTSSNARKECSQVSSRSPQSVSNCKLPSKRDQTSLKLGSNSVCKSARNSARTSSLKLVRTLTKTPSFKPARASAIRCSAVVLCEDLDVQRATCSSTLKDSRFPGFLELAPGATESEGTSVMKVCPYTYCSLNGHHHAPLPPLKCFLSARRRMIKIQKSIKIGCSSPRRAKPPATEVDTPFLNFASPNQEGLEGSTCSPFIQEEKRDFFVEIYVQEKGHAMHETTREEENQNDGSNDRDILLNDDGNAVGSLSNECLGTYSWDNLNQSRNIISTDLGVEFRPEENKKGEVTRAQEVAILEGRCILQDLVEEIMEHIQPIEAESEASDMDWEAWQYYAEYLDDSLQMKKEPDFHLHDSSDIYKQITSEDDPSNHDFEDEIADERLQWSFDEESMSSEAWFGSDESESAGSYEDSDIDDSVPALDNKSENQIVQTKNEDDSDKFGNIFSLLGNDKIYQVTSADNNISEAYLQVDLISEDMTNEDVFINPKDAVVEMHQFKDEILDGSTFCSGEETESDQNSRGLPAADSENPLDVKDEVMNAKLSNDIQNIDLLQGPIMAVQDTVGEDQYGSEGNTTTKEIDLSHDSADEVSPPETQGNNCQEISRRSDSTGDKDEHNSGMNNLDEDEKVSHVFCEVEEHNTEKNREKPHAPKDTSSIEKRDAFAENSLHQELFEKYKNLKGISRSKKPIQGNEEPRDFNPRAPNYLPLEPNPDEERVDLKPQMIDERKNAEEWMVDYALRQAVTKLAPARKRKVALLVEAFETVTPIPKCEPHLRHSSAPFSHSRPIQACS